jgi:hypothetical protein
MRSWTVLGVLSLLLLSTALPLLFASAQEPARSLSMEPLVCTTPDVLVSSNSSVRSYFETKVSVFDEVDELALVELNVTNDKGWPISVIPNSFNFTRPGSQRVNITITVPAGTDTATIAYIKLSGYAAFPGENTFASAAGFLYLKQSYGFSVNYTYTKLAPQETWIDLTIFNTGNGLDHFRVLLVDGEKVDNAKISVMLADFSRISPNSSRSQVLHFIYEGEKFPLKFDLKLLIISQGSAQKGVLVQQMIVVPLSFKGPDPPLPQNVFAGVIIAFVIVVVIILAVVLRGPSKKPR